MNLSSEKKSIGILFSLSIVLMFAAIFTATSSFAMPKEEDNSYMWDIKFSEPRVKEVDDKSSINIVNDNIDFHVLLKNFGDSYAFTTEVENNGNIDAYLADINKTDLSKIAVGTSQQTGKTYYVSDYVSFIVRYLENNQKNNIVVSSSLNSGDKLLSDTKNIISVNVKYKTADKLTIDQLEVLKNNLEKTVIDGYEYLAFELDLNINAVYQQLK